MAGRGPQTFKKRQKEQQRKERQEEKRARRFARREGGSEERSPNEQAGDAPVETTDSGSEAGIPPA